MSLHDSLDCFFRLYLSKVQRHGAEPSRRSRGTNQRRGRLLAKHASVSGSENGRSLSLFKDTGLRRAHSDAETWKTSTNESQHDTLKTELDASMSQRSGKAHLPESEAAGRVHRKVTSISESKQMIDAFIRQLFNFTDSVDVAALTDNGEGLNSEGVEEPLYRDDAYRQAHKTVMKMAPYAEKYMWHRISRVAAVPLRELADSKRRFTTTLDTSTPYYAGKCMLDNR